MIFRNMQNSESVVICFVCFESSVNTFYFKNNVRILCAGKVEDTKGVIRGRMLKKDRHYNDQRIKHDNPTKTYGSRDESNIVLQGNCGEYHNTELKT
jgi:hypothetical protein